MKPSTMNTTNGRLHCRRTSSVTTAGGMECTRSQRRETRLHTYIITAVTNESFKAAVNVTAGAPVSILVFSPSLVNSGETRVQVTCFSLATTPQRHWFQARASCGNLLMSKRLLLNIFFFFFHQWMRLVKLMMLRGTASDF